MAVWVIKYGRTSILDSAVDIVLDGFTNYQNHDIMPITHSKLLVCSEQELDTKVTEWQSQNPQWQLISIEPHQAM